MKEPKVIRPEYQIVLNFVPDLFHTPFKHQIQRTLIASRKSDRTDYKMQDLTTTNTTATGPRTKSRFVVFYKESILSVKVTDVSFFTLQDGNVQLCTLNGKAYPLKKSLSEIEAALNPELFFRVSRSAIVAYEGIERVEAFFGQRAMVFLKPKGKVLVTKARLAEFLDWLDN